MATATPERESTDATIDRLTEVLACQRCLVWGDDHANPHGPVGDIQALLQFVSLMGKFDRYAIHRRATQATPGKI